MNADEVRIAASNTLAFCLAETPQISPRQWRGYLTRPGCAPEKQFDRIADATWRLLQVPRLIDCCKLDDAFAMLIKAQTLLWVAKFVTSDKLNEFNKGAEKSTSTLA